MKKLKNKIILVITIIVLLILVGVVIKLLSSDKSVIEGAQETSGKYSVEAITMPPLVNGNASDFKRYIDTNNNASEYYGKYVTNYTPSGVTDVQWRIFYIGETPGGTENNIYLIADHYVPQEELPAANGTNILPNRGDTSYTRTAYFTNIIGAYSSGTGSIASDNSARSWLSKYWRALKKLNIDSSENNNMKAVAYMLDIEVWNKFNDVDSKDEEIAKYVIGGPTLEMFTTSWNQASGSSTTLTLIANPRGYYINYSNYIEGLTDPTNLWIPEAEYQQEEAYGMWIASPSYIDADNLMDWLYGGGVGSYNYLNNGELGFRPLVCLKSSIELKTNDEGATYQIVK